MEEATRMGSRRGKSSEEERREAEEKVIWIFQNMILSLSSGGEVRQVCEGGEGDADQLVLEQQEQEVNLRPDSPGFDCLISTIS